jgi:transcription-repair coupling factor (superfamily II helicase)
MVVWTEDWQYIREKISQQEEDLELYLEFVKTNPDNRKSIPDDDKEINEKTDTNENDFVKAVIIESQITQRHILEFGSKSYFASKQKNSRASNISFSIKSQPAFNRQFDLLIKDLKEYEAKKYNIFIFADNPKQLERLHIIFTDLKAEIQVIPGAYFYS